MPMWKSLYNSVEWSEAEDLLDNGNTESEETGFPPGATIEDIDLTT